MAGKKESEQGAGTRARRERPALNRPPLAKVSWRLGDLPDPSPLTAFSLFHCGGGSSMGYKLAGIDVLGGVEIDPDMSALYVRNLRPRYEFLESVVNFAERDRASLPHELLNLDLLDGSPPCSTFSMAGNRSADWGKERKFTEGQAVQVLDSLPMAWVRCVALLRPRVAIMENVVGMITGDAKGFVREVVAALARIDYDAQVFRLDASRMGVPQKRERVFVVARRRDLVLQPLRLAFAEAPITLREAVADLDRSGRKATKSVLSSWQKVLPGESLAKGNAKGHFFSWRKAHPDRPATTLTATDCMLWWDKPEHVDGRCAARIQTFPDDYDFGDEDPVYVCGMSVPPLMTQRIALELRKQWLDPLLDKRPRHP